MKCRLIKYDLKFRGLFAGGAWLEKPVGEQVGEA
jgi:hypothetical protein